MNRLNLYARSLAVWSLAGLGFALPLPPAWANLMLALVVIGWLSSGAWHDKWEALKEAPATHAAGLLMLMCVIGLFYGPSDGRPHYLVKYASLLLLPIAISLRLDDRERGRVLFAFCAAMGMTLALSVMIWLDWLPTGVFKGTPDNPTVFKLHITHNFFMAIAAFFAYTIALRQRNGARKWLMFAFALLAVVNVLFMVKGRTGQAVLLVLIAYLFHMHRPRYGLLAGTAFAIMLALTTYWMSPAFKDRVDLVAVEAAHWENHRGDLSSSTGTRLDFYTTTFAIIRQHPWLGVGTEGFPQAYKRQIADTSLPPTGNPHNQYLLTTAQLGILGLAALCWFYLCCWRQAKAARPPFDKIAVGILCVYVIANLFNSFMLDLSERLFFVWAMGCLLSMRKETTGAGEAGEHAAPIA